MTGAQMVTTVSGEKQTVATISAEKHANSSKRGAMNKTKPDKRNKAPRKAGCCAFIHAFLRLFTRKKRGQEKPAMIHTSLEEALPVLTHLGESALHHTVKEEHEPDVEHLMKEHEVKEHLVEEQEVEQHLMEEQKVKDHMMEEQKVEGHVMKEQKVKEPLMEEQEVKEPLMEEQEVKEHLMEEQEIKEHLMEEAVLEEAVKEQPVWNKSMAAQPAVEEPDDSDSDFDDDVADDSGSKQSFWEECPRLAWQGKFSLGKAENNSMMATAPPCAAPSTAHELLPWPQGTARTFHSAAVDPPASLVMGTNKHETDHLLTQATDRVVFFHMDDLPSAHVYLQLEPKAVKTWAQEVDEAEEKGLDVFAPQTSCLPYSLILHCETGASAENEAAAAAATEIKMSATQRRRARRRALAEALKASAESEAAAKPEETRAAAENEASAARMKSVARPPCAEKTSRADCTKGSRTPDRTPIWASPSARASENDGGPLVTEATAAPATHGGTSAARRRRARRKALASWTMREARLVASTH
ncbi:hypothetical protein O3P69_011734 [Scylla paramamosain]|uniref:Uncharacterized protein n=1 Tax=Scylla paramamosain TaxID=85552 RepID=A0AAW0SDT9_SCYPA